MTRKTTEAVVDFLPTGLTVILTRQKPLINPDTVVLEYAHCPLDTDRGLIVTREVFATFKPALVASVFAVKRFFLEIEILEAASLAETCSNFVWQGILFTRKQIVRLERFPTAERRTNVEALAQTLIRATPKLLVGAELEQRAPKLWTDDLVTLDDNPEAHATDVNLTP